MIWDDDDWKNNLRYSCLKHGGERALVKPIPQYPPGDRFPRGYYPKEIEANENLQYKQAISIPQEIEGIWESDDQEDVESMMDLCLIEENDAIDPLCLITPVKE